MASKSSIQFGWLDTIKNKIKAFEWLNSLDFSWSMLGTIIISFFASFLVGFLLKKSAKNILGALLLTLCIIALLYYFGCVIVDISKIKILIGLNPDDSFAQVLHHYYVWITIHKTGTIAAVIGFIIGYLIG